MRPVLDGMDAARVFIVPLCISEGWFTQEAIPVELGLKPAGATAFARAQCRGAQTLAYCGPVGTHAAMTRVLLDRARTVVSRHPFPREPKPAETALLLVGHGTTLDPKSRRAVEAQADAIRRLGLYAETSVAFMEEPPLIGDWPRITQARHVVVVPFFISAGLHVREDIPVLLGESESLVRQRVAAGRVPWRNPSAKHGRLLWYAEAVGTDPLVTEVVLARIREAAEFVPATEC